MASMEKYKKILLLLFGALIVVNVYENSGLMPYKDSNAPGRSFFPRPMEMIDPHDVLILTYMRSGSSFIGKILGWREDTFYWYEPLWVEHRWRYMTDDGQLCNYREDICRNQSMVNSTLTTKTSLKFLKDIYRCKNLYKYFRHFTVKLQGKSKFAGPTGATFTFCKDRELRTRTACLTCSRYNTSCEQCEEETKKKCFIHVMKRCKNWKHKVIKVLRMDTSPIQTLLEQHSRLKLVQIFRDPRAIINSRNITHWYYNETDPEWFHNETNYDTDFQVICKRIEKDLTAAEKLRSKYPDRVKILQYEDFFDPHRLATNLYTFTGMVMQPGFRTFLETLTDKEEAFHPYSYRTTLRWYLVKEINKHCHNVIKRLGLPVFKSEKDLRNRSLNVGDKLPYTLDDET